MSVSDPSRDAAGGRRQTWQLSLAYDGTAYHGWQIQSGVATLQGVLTDALRRLFREPDLTVQGTSRTDAGVHALDQQVSFAAPVLHGVDGAVIGKVLNRWLPQDIRVGQVHERPADFNARFHARGKAYVYGLHGGQTCSPFEARYLWHHPRPLQLDVMRQAAALLTGTHDFASFGVNPHREIASTVRTIHRLELVQHDHRLFFCVLGDSFLYKMVRSLVGYLVHVGRSKAWAPDHTRAVLQACDRGAAADTAPPQGLFLAKVFFAPDEWRAYVPPLPPFAM